MSFVNVKPGDKTNEFDFLVKQDKQSFSNEETEHNKHPLD